MFLQLDMAYRHVCGCDIVHEPHVQTPLLWTVQECITDSLLTVFSSKLIIESRHWKVSCMDTQIQIFHQFSKKFLDYSNFIYCGSRHCITEEDEVVLQHLHWGPLCIVEVHGNEVCEWTNHCTDATDAISKTHFFTWISWSSSDRSTATAPTPLIISPFELPRPCISEWWSNYSVYASIFQGQYHAHSRAMSRYRRWAEPQDHAAL